MPWTWHEATLSRIEQQSPTTKRFWLKLPKDTDFTFQAGQFVTMDLPISERRRQRWRSYSIANAPGNGELEFCIVRLDGGAGTDYLFNAAKEGDTIRFKGPEGMFYLPEPIEHDLVLICTGTGVAPFRSMLLDIHHRKLAHQGIHLIFGTRHESGILYREELEALRKEMPNFRYSVALSRESELNSMSFDFPVYPGYVHQIYERSYAAINPNLRFYLCGWANMVDEARERLTQMGYSKEQIIYELYG